MLHRLFEHSRTVGARKRLPSLISQYRSFGHTESLELPKLPGLYLPLTNPPIMAPANPIHDTTAPPSAQHTPTTPHNSHDGIPTTSTPAAAGQHPSRSYGQQHKAGDRLYGGPPERCAERGAYPPYPTGRGKAQLIDLSRCGIVVPGGGI